ncbi:uncharacterized protein [Physcomitrium patens]|uniref:uncharacterized protein isoform X2 n=1 Tax=Physcomitrium patens TaxID=3218 RepID=UPI003CCD3E93
MALRRPLGASSGEVMREDAIPCERITRIFATVAGIGGVFLAWPLCHIHYESITVVFSYNSPSKVGKLISALIIVHLIFLWQFFRAIFFAH